MIMIPPLLPVVIQLVNPDDQQTRSSFFCLVTKRSSFGLIHHGNSSFGRILMCIDVQYSSLLLVIIPRKRTIVYHRWSLFIVLPVFNRKHPGWSHSFEVTAFATNARWPSMRTNSTRRGNWGVDTVLGHHNATSSVANQNWGGTTKCSKYTPWCQDAGAYIAWQ